MLGIRQSQIGLWTLLLVLLCSQSLVAAHHGGLGIEGDLVQWALKVDQWQDEGIDQGQRIKFLTYPRQPIVKSGTRLVFEIQSTSTGQYVSGLTPQVDITGPDGVSQVLHLPETTGVTAYYETVTVFAQEGEYTITFRASTAGVPFSSTFRRTVNRSTLHGDWSVLLGYGVVVAAFLVTWVGCVFSVQRRFAGVWGADASTPAAP